MSCASPVDKSYAWLYSGVEIFIPSSNSMEIIQLYQEWEANHLFQVLLNVAVSAAVLNGFRRTFPPWQ